MNAIAKCLASIQTLIAPRKKREGMPNWVKIYLPTKREEDIQKYAEDMVSLFGGCTVVKGLEGYWMNDKGETIRDDITWLISYSSVHDLALTTRMGKGMALLICRAYHQDCVSLEVNGVLHFISDKETA